MRHPIESCNEEQARFLASLPNNLVEFWARQFRLGNATYCYQTQFSQFSGESEETALEWLERQLMGAPDPENRTAAELLNVYFDEWLDGLPEAIRSVEQQRGVDEAKRSYPFRRYVLERNDLGMDEFLKKNLSAEDYAYNQELGKKLRP